MRALKNVTVGMMCFMMLPASIFSEVRTNTIKTATKDETLGIVINDYISGTFFSFLAKDIGLDPSNYSDPIIPTLQDLHTTIDKNFFRDFIWLNPIKHLLSPICLTFPARSVAEKRDDNYETKEIMACSHCGNSDVYWLYK